MLLYQKGNGQFREELRKSTALNFELFPIQFKQPNKSCMKINKIRRTSNSNEISAIYIPKGSFTEAYKISNPFAKMWYIYPPDSNFSSSLNEDKRTPISPLNAYPIDRCAILLEKSISALELESCLSKPERTTLDCISSISFLTNSIKKKKFNLHNTVYLATHLTNMWKLPIRKSKHVSIASDYRTISLLYCSQNYWKKSRLSWFLESNNLITKQ